MPPLTHWEGEPVAVWARLWGVPALEAHDTLPSTNDRARALAEGGAAPFTVVVADHQTAGRGRSGAAWLAPPGAGLLLSVPLPLDAGEPAPHLPLLVGLAAARAAEAAAPDLAVRIKWPNDLVVGERKAGGVLCEAVGGGAVAGVGVNVRQRPDDFPPGLRDRVTSLEVAAGARVSRSALAGRFLGELRALVGRVRGSTLPEAARAELAARDWLRGRRVRTGVGEGVAAGIDRDGALLVRAGEGTLLRVVAGSVEVG